MLTVHCATCVVKMANQMKGKFKVRTDGVSTSLKRYLKILSLELLCRTNLSFGRRYTILK